MRNPFEEPITATPYDKDCVEWKVVHGKFRSHGMTRRQAQYAAHAINSHESLAGLLPEIEWACVTSAGNQYCPSCRNTKGQGHVPHCKIAALLQTEKDTEERS